MCGIFVSASPRRVQAMLAAMRHRGPDETSTLDRGGMVLGFNRLAIVDLESPAARQPYETRKGNVVLFNGEIYNYRKLWSDAPSEVALIAEMLDEGLDPRHFFDGDYAIVYYNPSTQHIDLYRDRFGMCPLYFQMSHGIEISSEARRLVAPSEVPAHGRVRISLREKSFTVDRFPLYGITSDAYSLKALAQMVEQAVVSRATHTESGFSLALSGGLDSSIIAYALREAMLEPAAAICTSFSAESEDLKFARMIADDLHFKFIPVPVKLSPYETTCIREHFDGPISPMRWRGGLRTYFVAKHSPTRVILGGDGPDELIGGYPCHQSFGREYRANAKRLSTIRSMQHFNLDRTNKMGMAHSKEFRAPFLASTASQFLLASPLRVNKKMFRSLLRYYGAPEEVVFRESKYSPDELAIETLP